MKKTESTDFSVTCAGVASCRWEAPPWCRTATLHHNRTRTRGCCSRPPTRTGGCSAPPACTHPPRPTLHRAHRHRGHGPAVSVVHVEDDVHESSQLAQAVDNAHDWDLDEDVLCGLVLEVRHQRLVQRREERFDGHGESESKSELFQRRRERRTPELLQNAERHESAVKNAVKG